MGQVSLISGVERRRRWSEEEKRELLAAAFGPGGSPAEVARRTDICTSLLYRWRRILCSPGVSSSFVPAIIREDARQPDRSAPEPPAITVVMPGRATVRISRDASPALIRAALEALR